MNIIDNFFMLIEIGGPVMVPICIISSWLWILVLLKADWIYRANRSTVSIHQAMDYLSKAPPKSAFTCPKTETLTIFTAALKKHSSSSPDIDKLFLEAAVKKQTKAIYRYIPTIILLAATAPLRGLFGTVSGMVETFKVIGLYGMGNAQAMASGIREAMITTQAGLLVAIPGIFIGQLLRKKAQNIHRELLIFQRGISQLIDREQKQ